MGNTIVETGKADHYKDNNNALVSIIVPVYNGETFIQDCIQRLVHQSYKNIEIIIINDGSTDKTGEICKKISESDYRIIYIEKSNGGVSSARNTGMNIAHGNYIVFVDADDYLDEFGVELFVDSVNESSADLVCSLYNEFGDNTGTPTASKNHYSYNEIPTSLEELWPFMMGPWGKLFNIDIINKYNLRFSEKMPYGEDAVFNLHYLSYCNNIYILKKVLYSHRIYAGGASNDTHYYEEMNVYLYKIYKGIQNITDQIKDFELKRKINYYFYNALLTSAIKHYLLHKCKDRETKIKQSIEMFNDENFISLESLTDKENRYICDDSYKKFIRNYYSKNCAKIIKTIIKRDLVNKMHFASLTNEHADEK